MDTVMEAEMVDRKTDPEWLAAEDPHALLERVIAAEYLLCRGCLMAELDAAFQLAACNFKRKACQYAETKIAEIEHPDPAQRKFRLSVHLN
jgi:hypothetical protein